MNVTLYPIYWLADWLGGEPFSLSLLPFDITENVRIEDVSGRFRRDAFRQFKERMGTERAGDLENVRYALVHRYSRSFIGRGDERHSEETVRAIASCLRLIRPMRQAVMLMRGEVRGADEAFDINHIELPDPHLIEVPEVQKLFQLRDQDAHDLRLHVPKFLRAVRGDSGKFRMAVEFHDLGHFQAPDWNWKARFMLWCSAIESIYTSHDREHQTSLVAIARIKWFLGDDRNIYEPGDFPGVASISVPRITVGQIASDLYDMRNYVVHGDSLPDSYGEIARQGIDGGICKRDVLIEAASFIIRASLLKILGESLLDHFIDSESANAYFAEQGLTRSKLQAARTSEAQANRGG